MEWLYYTQSLKKIKKLVLQVAIKITFTMYITNLLYILKLVRLDTDCDMVNFANNKSFS